MLRTRTTRISATAAAAVTLLAVAAAPALADGHSILRAELVGSMPDGPMIAHIPPGAAPWVNGPSSVRVRKDGRIDVSIMGLVIPPPKGTNTSPISSVVATLVCDDMARASTAPFALSAAGNGATSTMIAGTRHCDDPVVLIQPEGRPIYIASSMGDHDDD